MAMTGDSTMHLSRILLNLVHFCCVLYKWAAGRTQTNKTRQVDMRRAASSAPSMACRDSGRFVLIYIYIHIGRLY